MKTYLDCYPCFLRQALSAARRADASADQQRQILLKTMEELASLPADTTPLQMAFRIHRVLIETLDQSITYVVKASPIINDAAREDAIAAGIDQAAEIIDNGSDAPGTLFDQCSQRFRERFSRAKLIIAKGQANYESLSDSPSPIFFLLQAKCSVIARNLGVDEGSIILKQQKSPLTSHVESYRYGHLE